MLIRLLLVVLTVVGPMPFRVCTCAAAPTPAPVDEEPPVQFKSCHCSHADHAETTVPDERDARAAKCSDDLPAPAHERDCPAVTSFACESACPQADTPTDGVPTLALCRIAPEPLRLAPVTRHNERAHTPRLPLYITLLSLRN